MKAAIVTCLITLCAGGANADIIASCGASKGMAYYSLTGKATSQSAGWQEDGISGGSTVLSISESGDYDILFYDASKSIRSTIAEGGMVELISVGDTIATFVAINSGTSTDTYMFTHRKDDHSELVVTSTRSDENFFPRASVFVSECDKLDLNIITSIEAARDAAEAAAAAAAAYAPEKQ